MFWASIGALHVQASDASMTSLQKWQPGKVPQSVSRNGNKISQHVKAVESKDC